MGDTHRPGLPKLQHAAASHDRLDDAFAKPRAVAVHPPGQRGDDRQAGDDVSVEAIEGGREAASPRRGPRRFVLGDWTRARRAVAARVRDVHNPPRRACRHRVEQVRIHRHARACDGCGASPCHARPTLAVRWKMKDPVSRRLVLPLTRLEQVAHDRYRSGTTHALRGLRGLRETATPDGHGPRGP